MQLTFKERCAIRYQGLMLLLFPSQAIRLGKEIGKKLAEKHDA